MKWEEIPVDQCFEYGDLDSEGKFTAFAVKTGEVSYKLIEVSYDGEIWEDWPYPDVNYPGIPGKDWSKVILHGKLYTT